MRNGFYGVSNEQIATVAQTPQQQIVGALALAFWSLRRSTKVNFTVCERPENRIEQCVRFLRCERR